MRIKCHLEYIDIDDEIIATPVGKGSAEIHGVLKMNTAGKEILKILSNDTSEEYVVKLLSSKYENEREEIATFVHSIINVLRQNGLIDE